MAEEQQFLTEDDEFEAAFAARSRQDDELQDPAPAGDDEPGEPVHDGQDLAGDDEPGDPIHDDADLSGDDEPAIRRKAHSYDSLLGRHKKTQELLRQAEARLAEMAKPPAAPRMAPTEIPEDLRDDLAVISGLDPELAALVTEQSPDGERLRQAMTRFGPESAAAMAESVRTRRVVEHGRRSEAAAATVRAEQSHYGALMAGVPELGRFGSVGVDAHGKAVLMPKAGREQEFTQYFDGLRGWIEDLPYKAALACQDILANGAADAVADVLKTYNQARNPRDHVDRDLADELAPVRSRGRGPAMGTNAPPDSFEGAFQRRVREEGRRKA